MNSPAVATVPLAAWETGKPLHQKTDQVAVEEPLEIRLNGEALVTLMRTPGDDQELVAGFLFTEGIVTSPEDIASITPCPHPGAARPGNVLNVTLSPEISIDWSQRRRHFVASSSCGVCSKTTIEMAQEPAPVLSSLRVSPDVLQSLPDQLRRAQETFSRTGGLHACAWFSPAGSLLAIREDVGRHNALDKLIGHRFLRHQDVPSGILLVSGRVAFEIVQKAFAARLPVLAAISAPTSQAVECAERNGQTLVGFLREGRMNIYSHPQRIVSGQNSSCV